MIKLENVFVKKGNKNILDGCNFNFEKGKSYALVGESGAGKSTLLNIIAGFEDVSQGSIYIEDKLLKKKVDFYRYTLGYLFQNFALALKFKKNKKDNMNLKKEVLKKVGLDLDIKRIVSSLSGGEQQRVALARLILKDPKIILADEPTGSLDTKNGKIVIDLLLKLLDENKTMIVVTHDLELAKRFDVIVNISELRS
ncbi:TPA: ATP-binding cassette domain-containing protein [Staphylococcus aureus]|nr:ATP-binding cassette domain-containing protein [Staphylococcus aureus]HCZ8630401.1 ATP-binding cassette domain-containing protein [Staphylococcus aureus]HDA5385606.1 ATP-binding cassette domain-containing protein [Staphylococcus aureus]HDA5385788.1 ATP-binding cassette domain-containing protein [Staphylococcus aureus]